MVQFYYDFFSPVEQMHSLNTPKVEYERVMFKNLPFPGLHSMDISSPVSSDAAGHGDLQDDSVRQPECTSIQGTGRALKDISWLVNFLKLLR